MKDFSKTRWVDCLRNRDWTRIESIQDVNEQAEEFTKEVNEALDECANIQSTTKLLHLTITQHYNMTSND